MAGFQRLGGGGSFSRGRSTRHNSVLHGLSTRFPYENFLNLAAMVVLLLVCYGGLFLVFGRTFLPLQGHMWAVSLIWICSHVGGYLTTKVGLPPLLGMLLTGVMLRNVPQDPVQGLPHLWSSKIRTAGLALILMRAGLQLDLQTFRRYRATALLLGTLPVLGEALSASLVFHFMFHMPTFLAISAGFICAAISPTVLVTGMLELQKRGYGSAKGIPSMEMAAAGLDVTLAIAGYSVFIGLAVPYEALGWSIAHGPLSIAFGVVAGACGGLICSCTWLWNTTLKRAAIVLTVGEALMFLGYKTNFLGAGCIAMLSMSVMASLLWSWGAPRLLAGHEPNDHLARDVDSKLASVWNLLAQPLLFGVIGTTLDFRNIRPESAYLPKTVSLIAIGLGARASFALLALVRSEYTGRERLFIALSWLPKATVQGALCSAPLDLILDHEAYSPNFLQQKQWGQEIITTAIFSIIICAPIGLLASGLLGPLWLSKDETLDGQVSGEPGNQQANPFANGRRFDEENVADMAVSLHSKTGRMLGNPFADEPHGDGSPLLLSRMSGSPQRFGTGGVEMVTMEAALAQRTPSGNPFSPLSAPDHGHKHFGCFGHKYSAFDAQAETVSRLKPSRKAPVLPPSAPAGGAQGSPSSRSTASDMSAQLDHSQLASIASAGPEPILTDDAAVRESSDLTFEISPSFMLQEVRTCDEEVSTPAESRALLLQLETRNSGLLDEHYQFSDIEEEPGDASLVTDDMRSSHTEESTDEHQLAQNRAHEPEQAGSAAAQGQQSSSNLPGSGGVTHSSQEVADAAAGLDVHDVMLGLHMDEQPSHAGADRSRDGSLSDDGGHSERRSLLSAVARSHSDGSVDGDVADVHGPHGMPTLAPPLTPSLSSSGRAASGDLVGQIPRRSSSRLRGILQASLGQATSPFSRTRSSSAKSLLEVSLPTGPEQPLLLNDAAQPAGASEQRPPAANPSPHSQPMRSGFRPNSHRRSHSQDIPEAVNLYDDDAEDAQLLASVRMRRSLSSHTEPLPGMRQPNDAGPSSPHVIPKGTMSLEQFLMVAQKSVAANSLPTVHGEDAEESSGRSTEDESGGEHSASQAGIGASAALPRPRATPPPTRGRSTFSLSSMSYEVVHEEPMPQQLSPTSMSDRSPLIAESSASGLSRHGSEALAPERSTGRLSRHTSDALARLALPQPPLGGQSKSARLLALHVPPFEEGRASDGWPLASRGSTGSASGTLPGTTEAPALVSLGSFKPGQPANPASNVASLNAAAVAAAMQAAQTDEGGSLPSKAANKPARHLDVDHAAPSVRDFQDDDDELDEVSLV